MAKNDYSLGQVNMRNGGRGRMRVAEKPKDFKGAWKMIFTYCSKYSAFFCIAIFCAITSVVLQLFAPNQLSKITDLIELGMEIGHVDVSGVISIAIKLGLFYLFSSVLLGVQSITLSETTQRIVKLMRSDISKKLNRLPLKCFDSTSFGDLLSRVTNDVDTIGMSLNGSLVHVVTAFVTFIGCFIVMMIKNQTLALISLSTSLIGFVIIRIISKRSQPYFSARQLYLGLLNGHIEEIYAGHTVVKAYNGEDSSLEEFNYLNQKLYESNWKSQFLGGMMHPLMEFIGNFGYLAVCVVGAIMVKDGLIRFGTIVEFIVYTRFFSQPLSQVAEAMTNLQSAAAAGERVFSFLQEEEMEDESYKTTVLDAKKGHVVFDHVKFGYDPGKTIIHDFSIEIQPGQKVAIVGPTGAGKTTLVNLLMRFYELDGGAIYIDGVNIKDITRENVHNLFCMVLQDTWLFNGTIKENIIYRAENVSDEQIIDACKSVGLHHYIESLPDGYDTVLSEESNLSAGQMQLLTIARAIIENAPLLILDEATSSVDTRTEQIVQNAMEKLTQGRTSFTIAHRLSTIRDADVIIVMKDGDIVETGTHLGLLEEKGFYYNLWNSQFTQGAQL